MIARPASLGPKKPRAMVDPVPSSLGVIADLNLQNMQNPYKGTVPGIIFFRLFRGLAPAEGFCRECQAFPQEKRTHAQARAIALAEHGEHFLRTTLYTLQALLLGVWGLAPIIAFRRYATFAILLLSISPPP